ncbi:Por secretion system C-terminal sorting domain-containing protein [Pustulibacterium marinum]|uniref:Por secretion system C-terminal sorting domain-containing protein n=1 Tax=Pustulibacterium marinum TaxID=1224947 RepID=A0A1I7I6T0_9FLAO|nr:M12 family metallo-peptidase [Pustulibacterium marinum]SFU68649.1 Por secretion system C-terminal sorting domain-containing protein [Pustulibacterium marinum]
MRKILFVFGMLFLTTASTLFGQNRVGEEVSKLKKAGATFESYNILSENPSLATKATKEVVKNATYASVDLETVSNIFNNASEYISLQIPYNGNTIEATLYRVNLFTDDFHIDTDKKENIPYNGGVYYRGIIDGEVTSVASFSFFEEEFNGVVSSNELGNIIIGKLDVAKNTSDYIVYQDENLLADLGGVCGTDDTKYTPNEENGDNHKSNLETNTTNCVTLYFEIDYDLYVQNGSDETTTTNWMTSVFNNVQTLYDNDGITTALKSLYIWTTDDPYSGSSSSDYLYQFNDERPVFDGDLGMLVGIDPGGLGGVAVTIGGFCSQNNFSYSDVNYSYSTVPTYSWTVQVITHELGHLMGSPHTHGCYWNGDSTSIDGCGQQAGYSEGSCATGPIPYSAKGTIMSYCHLISGVGISFSNGFGTQPTALITNTIEASNCLSTDCINTCINMIESVSFSNVTSTSFDISWVDNSDTSSWQISVIPLTSIFNSWNTVTTNSYSVSGLNENTYYKVNIRPNCSANSQTIYPTSFIGATGGDVCAGMVFTDTGGTTDEYDNNETIVRTFVPDQENSAVTATFTSFALEEDWDYMYIYDGADTTAELLTPDGLTGFDLPGTYTSSAEDGSLTFEFISDSYVTEEGWEASISCTSTAATDSFSMIEYSYYPNPTSGEVTIKSKSEITNVAVYSVTGQLLLEKKPATTVAQVDISKFATGTYFFSMEIEGKTVNFKVMKY